LEKNYKKIENLIMRLATEDDKKIAIPSLNLHKKMNKAKKYNRENNTNSFNNRNQFQQNRGQFRHPTSRGIQKNQTKFHVVVPQNLQQSTPTKTIPPVIQQSPEEIEMKQKRNERFNLSKKNVGTSQEITID